MANKLKPIDQQVIVITGASSGIGLATAQSASEQGAKVALLARSKKALDQIVEKLPGEALAVECDVSNRAEVEQATAKVLAEFGRIDTWVNNAGVSIYGWIEEVSEQDSRRLFDTNFWGVYNGSLVALLHLKPGSALINVGSEVSEAIVPLQGIYSASKHAVKGFTDALRVEIEEIDKREISITLIQPTAVNTPYPEHARNYLPEEAKLPTPQIEAEEVAKAIIHAATNPTRATKVGMMAKVNTTIAKLLPSLGDKLSAKQVDRQTYQEPPRNPRGALYEASETTGVVGMTAGTGGIEARH